MTEQDFPALFRSADALAKTSQKHFYGALKAHLLLLVVATSLSAINYPHWFIPTLQLVVLLAVLFCSIYLFSKRPDRSWYTGRAVAESIKTVTWRYVTRAEPFDTNETQARSDFHRMLKDIVDQNREVAASLTDLLDEPQISSLMTALRSKELQERMEVYRTQRIQDQLTWYAKKAAFNRKASQIFFGALIAANGIAVLCAILRIIFFQAPFWPTDIFTGSAASLLSWMQAKRFSELSASYALTAHEIGLVREGSMHLLTEKAFSEFVGDAENAFSREHTQWVARKDG